MFTVAEIYEIPKIGIMAACYSDKWDTMTKEAVEKEVSKIHEISIDNKKIPVLDYSVDFPFSGGLAITLLLGNDKKLLNVKCPFFV